MNNKDTIDMIHRCIEEIEMQRREIDRLRPKAEAYDAITVILGLLSKPPQGYGEDIVWRLRKQLDELRQNEMAELAKAGVFTPGAKAGDSAATD